MLAPRSFGRFAQSSFHARRLLAERSHRFAMCRHARGHVTHLPLCHFRLDRQARRSRFNLRRLLAIECNPVLRAVQVQRRLAQQILNLPQLRVELVSARAQPFLLGFQFVHRTRFALFRRIHFAQQFFQPRRFLIQMLGLARQHAAQQPAHLFAQLRITPRLRRLALQRSQLLFHFHQNVVDARKIHFRSFQFRFRQSPLGFVHRDSGGFFDYRAAVHRLRIQNLPDAALLDDGVAVRAQVPCP